MRTGSAVVPATWVPPAHAAAQRRRTRRRCIQGGACTASASATRTNGCPEGQREISGTALRSEPEPDTETGIDRLAPEEAQAVARAGKVQGYLEVSAEEAPVGDLQPPAQAEEERRAVLHLDGERHPPVEREARHVERQPGANGGAGTAVAGAGGEQPGPEFQVDAQRVQHCVAAEEIDARAKAVGDAAGGTLPADGDVGVHRRL